ncbi:LysR family transcriptional regulator [Pigmentiphaga soli]|uniref:LysR family transcriptional regulator n=1 Tax=Pigmentiphaga soli TaxID=1007095 RepID=A0ABP8GSC9_9BURK
MNAIEQLACMAAFARVVDTMSYTRAAAALGVSKSAVSKDVARLEEALGVTLLRRTTRRIDVTEVGRAYYDYCARLLAEQRSANAFVRQYADEAAGNLRVAAPVTFGNRTVAPALCEFVGRNVHVQADLELTDRIVDPRQEELDVAVVIARELPEGLQARALMPIEWGLYASPAYLDGAPPVRQPDDLRRHGFLSFQGPAHWPALPLRKGRRAVELKVRPLMRANNSTALLRAAQAGLGVAYLPRYVVGDAVADGSLRRLLPDWLSDASTAYAACAPARFLVPRVRLFVDTLAEYCAGEARRLADG